MEFYKTNLIDEKPLLTRAKRQIEYPSHKTLIITRIIKQWKCFAQCTSRKYTHVNREFSISL